LRRLPGWGESEFTFLPAELMEARQAMWNALAHLAGPTLLTTAIAVLGTSVRAVFRYPHMWRYLEIRHRSDIRLSGRQLPCRRFGRYCRRTHQRGRCLCLTGQREEAAASTRPQP
jgi:hypothetical protein